MSDDHKSIHNGDAGSNPAALTKQEDSLTGKTRVVIGNSLKGHLMQVRCLLLLLF